MRTRCLPAPEGANFRRAPRFPRILLRREGARSRGFYPGPAFIVCHGWIGTTFEQENRHLDGPVLVVGQHEQGRRPRSDVPAVDQSGLRRE